MDYLTHIGNLRKMDKLIRLECTGPAKDFAEKLGISRRTVFNHIDDLKAMGAEIIYDFIKRSYCYTKPFTLKF